MRSTLGFPTRGSKPHTNCSTHTLWLYYFRKLFQQGPSPSCLSSRSFFTRSAQERRDYQLWLLTGLDHPTSYLIRPSFCHRHFRARSKSALATHSTSTAVALTSPSPSSPTSLLLEDSLDTDRVVRTTKNIETKLVAKKPLLHPRYFNASGDVESQLQQIKAHRDELDDRFIFKSLRSMLYNSANYNQHLAWSIYESMVDLNVTEYLQANHYGHLLNILKYAPSCTPMLLHVLDRMQSAQEAGRLVIGNRHYSQILFGMSRQGKVEQMTLLLESLCQRPGISVQPTWFTSLAIAAKKNGNSKTSVKAANLMEKAMKQGVLIEKEACAVMISALADDMEATIQFLTSMKSAGMMITKSSNDTQISKHTTDDLNIHLYTSLIASAARTGDAKKARRLWAEMRRNGVAPTTVTYAAMTEAYGRSGNLNGAILFLKRHTYRNNGKVNKVMATSVLTNAIRLGELKLAKSLLCKWVDEMGLEIEKTDTEFRSAVMWIKVMEDVDAARKFFSSLYKENKSYVDSVMVNHLVKGYGNAGRKEHVLDSFELHDTLGASTIVQNRQIDRHFFLVDSLFKCQDVQAALTAFTLMRRHTVPDDITYAMVIRGLVMNGENETAWRLFKALKTDGLEPNLHAYTSVLKACIRKDRKVLPEHEQQHLSTGFVEEALGITEASSTASNIIGNSKVGPTQAYILFRKMTGYQKPNAYTYTTLIACFAKQNIGRAVDIFTHMCANGVHPVMETYIALLQGCAIFRNAPMAITVFKHLREQQGLVPDGKVWHYLLKALVRSRVDKKEIDRLGAMVRGINKDINQ